MLLWSVFSFYTLKVTNCLRISPEEEKLGLDKAEGGGGAYHIDSLK